MTFSSDREFFIPAETPAEAVARIYGLTGVHEQGRGEKRALVALRDALGLDVDVVRTNAVLGEQIAIVLNVEWVPAVHTLRYKVTLAGLNQLLEGATDAFRQGALVRRAPVVPTTLNGPGWAEFNPAVSKIEAVTRIARLTNSPDEWLGPGSKEHKSVLTNLADSLFPGASLDRSSKTRLGRSLAGRLDVQWTDSCYSTGETISLLGLNTVLAGAERRLGRIGTTAAEMLASPEAEGAALVAALNDGWRAAAWDGRETVGLMDAQGLPGKNQNEWQGWYFEGRAREILTSSFPPNSRRVRARYGNTVFDYSLNYVWDLKAHTEEKILPKSGRRSSGGSSMILNDAAAIRACVAEQGLGFLVLGGRAVMDEDGTFVAWHREFKERQGIRTAPNNGGRSRPRKAGFIPLHVEAFWVADTLALDAAVAAGQLALGGDGLRNPPKTEGAQGALREPKFMLHLPRARDSLLVGRREWRYPKSVP